MSAKRSCKACADLQEHSPEFIANGVTDDVYNSLINDTGFNPSSGHNDCTDLNDANDCLVGTMEEEVDSYSMCDWKKFMKKFIRNLWHTLKAIIAAICGLWTFVHKHECEINYLYQGQNFRIGENTSGDAYAVAGKGVSFIGPHAETANTSDLHIRYIAGGLMLGGGSLYLYSKDWDEQDTKGNKIKVGNFDLASSGDTRGYHIAYNRKGNTIWGGTGVYASGGELLVEFRIKRSSYPQIKQMYTGFGTHANARAFLVNVYIYDEGEWAYGQHGSCYNKTDSEGHVAGHPTHENYDYGHKVPKGWTYVQVRMSYCMEGAEDGAQISPHYFVGVRMNQDSLDCN